MRTSKPLHIEPIGGDQYPDLETVQRAALPQLAESFQGLVKDLLQKGLLVNVNGKIIPNPTLEAK